MYKVILLSLNTTLARNWQATNLKMPDAEDWIRDREEYHLWLTDWLRKVDSQVYLFTVRKVRYQEVTLDAIARRVSWKPDRAYFNDTPHTGSEGGKVKSILLARLLEETNLKLSELYAFESNGQALRMWKRKGVAHRKVTEAGHLPPIEWFTESSK